MIKIFAMPINGKKTFENFFIRTWKAEDLETWYAALGTGLTRFIQMVTIGWPWPILNM